MKNNDILRSIQSTFKLSDSKIMDIFSQADHQETEEQISNCLKKENDPDYQALSDNQLAIFLNGFINDKRGKKEGAQPVPDSRLTNNIIFVKLKIALNLQAEDILEILALVNFRLSKHELSAFFRKPGQKHYRECKDTLLNSFLKGVELKYRSAAG